MMVYINHHLYLKTNKVNSYKLSKYNFFHRKNEETTVCINLVNKNIFALDNTKIDLINKNKCNIDIIEELNPFLFSALIKLGVIVKSETNEINNLLYEHRNQIYNKKSVRLTIMPTLECNFKCWYCYEDRVDGCMDNSTVKSIINFSKKLIEEGTVNNFQLDWFGGEPLMYFDDVVYVISAKIKNLCKKHNINFSNIITTNGALITPEMVIKFKEIQLNGFQITLDGNEQAHNKVKFNDTEENIYKKTLKSIFEIIDIIQNPSVMLRINYTPKNYKGLKDIIDDIPDKYRKKIEIALQQVWQTENSKVDIKIEDCNNEFVASGFIAPMYKLDTKCYKCYADVDGQYVINFDGNVFKCTARDFANHEPEGILRNGEIIWNDVFYKRMSKTPIENEKCISCFLLPACWGPCSQKVLEYKEGEFEKICNYSGIEKTVITLLNNFYNEQILENN